MKDVVLYAFFCVLYAILGWRYFAPEGVDEPVLTWQLFGAHLLFFAAVATLARWTVLAFKKRPERLPAGQTIVGVEEPEVPSVLEVVKPVVLAREQKKPRLKKRR